MLSWEISSTNYPKFSKIFPFLLIPLLFINICNNIIFPPLVGSFVLRKVLLVSPSQPHFKASSDPLEVY